MSCNDCNKPVPPAGDNTGDVYFVGGLVSNVSTGTPPDPLLSAELALNCEELRAAYDSSSASAVATFAEFEEQVHADATAGLNESYPEVAALNLAWQDSPNARRIINIRVCIKWRWLRIYIIIRI